ncbi:MAG: hypothetical protein KGO50_10075 [Myxococcales bacterium]|nr:hypothetical protein [Myxococcales bacterium]
MATTSEPCLSGPPVTDPIPTDSTPDQKPPFLGSWRNVYAAVLLLLALYVVVMGILTRVYA